MSVNPCSWYGGEDEQWTCIFPGKMGISWKIAWNSHGTKAEAEAQAAKNRNVLAVPLALWLRYREYEYCLVVAKQKLVDELGLRLDYVDEKPVFAEVPSHRKLAGIWVEYDADWNPIFVEFSCFSKQNHN
jgi:hypothetical protein